MKATPLTAKLLDSVNRNCQLKCLAKVRFPPRFPPLSVVVVEDLADDGIIDGSQILPLAMRIAEIFAGAGACDGIVARQLATLYQQILEKCML